jgi:FKBP-type peptidyl-prolyl cis-trans isomerase
MIGRFIRMTILFLTSFSMILLVSCETAKKLESEEDNNIQQYLANNSNLDFVLEPSGIYYLQLVEGTGVSPVRADSAYVTYTGKFLNGQIIYSNSSTHELYGFIVGQKNITGFDEGVILMKVGGKATLLIPSELAYGSYGSYPIPRYTPLLFDIELVKVVQLTGK